MNTPSPFLRHDAPVLDQLVGARLERVSYHYLPAADSAAYRGAAAGVDGDLAAVILGFEGRSSVAVTWAMLGDLEGLAFLGDDKSYSGTASDVIEARDSPAWRERVGETVTSVTASWHVSGDAPTESLLALSLEFESDAVSIALGTSEPRVAYMPDELVVIHDPTLARSYLTTAPRAR